MFRSTIRRLTIALTSAATAVAVSFFSAAPAQAGFFDGDVSNRLPSQYTVKIATFGGGSSSCYAFNHNTSYSCTHWWLPSGKADDQIRGSNFDTDGFMVESSYRAKIYNGNGALLINQMVPAFQWTKIRSGANANCELVSGTPTCTVR